VGRACDACEGLAFGSGDLQDWVASNLVRNFAFRLTALDIALSQDFFPKVGGAHSWLYETYRRWPSPVKLLTRRYNDTADEVCAEASFDDRDHGALQIVRRDIAIDAINLLDKQCRGRFWNVVKEIRELSGDGPTFIHCIRAFPEGFCGFLTKCKNPRSTCLITYAHGEEVLVAKSSAQLKLMASFVYWSADLVIANSRSTEKLVRDLCPKANIVCIHPGVDSAAYVPSRSSREEFRRRWKWPAETIVVSTVARMEPRKNQSMVIRAIADLRGEGLPLAYVCGGDGEERAKLDGLVQSLGLQAWVRFTGTLSDEEKILTYGASDIFAMPSIQSGQMIEGFGIVFLEAAAAGMPSISGNVGGQAEAVREGETGFVVDGLDLAEVKDAIKRLASDASLRKEMGQKGTKWANLHDWSRISSQVSTAVREHASHRAAG
jgi:phosphatidyl-myo-inositol dimannoside synthase